jgi:hypothetical protein
VGFVPADGFDGRQVDANDGAGHGHVLDSNLEFFVGLRVKG